MALFFTVHLVSSTSVEISGLVSTLIRRLICSPTPLKSVAGTNSVSARNKMMAVLYSSSAEAAPVEPPQGPDLPYIITASNKLFTC